MKPWARIRHERPDLTDYVMHLTKPRFTEDGKTIGAFQVLLEILRSGHLRPTFSPKPNRRMRQPRNTIRGPDPAVCFTEQPIWALLTSRFWLPGHYSGYGIAYHKNHLFMEGGRPVLYANDRQLGRPLKAGEDGFEEGKDIWTGGLPRELQYLWVNYDPSPPHATDPGIDFTWEREWRIKPRNGPQSLFLSWDQSFDPHMVIVVEKDADVPIINDCVCSLVPAEYRWEYYGKRVASLETAKRLQAEDERYRKLDTWPFPSVTAAP